MDIILILIALCIAAVGIFFFVRWAWGKLFPESNDMLDHVPVNRNKAAVEPEPKKKVGTTPDQAKARHGKPFRAHALVARETPLSRDLLELDQLSAKKAAHTVTAIKSKK